MHAVKTMVVQQLVEQAADKTTRTWDQTVPPQYHVHAKVFSEDTAQRFPESREWNHAIDLKLNVLWFLWYAHTVRFRDHMTLLSCDAL